MKTLDYFEVLEVVNSGFLDTLNTLNGTAYKDITAALDEIEETNAAQYTLLNELLTRAQSDALYILETLAGVRVKR